jgi:nucleoside-diphosphate-sugar epimerase
MYCLITGSNGFLGKELIRELSGTIGLKCLSKSKGDYQVNLEDDVPFFKETFQMVIHAAGLAHFMPRQSNDIDFFHRVNVIGTENLLKALERNTLPKRFVFISSVSVYGESEGRLINEDYGLKAIDLYGRSKIGAEQLVLNWCIKHHVIYTILRLPLIVGNNPPGNLGAMIKGIKRGYYFNIAGVSAQKSMVLAEDIAKYILKVSEIGGIYNLTDGYHPSFAELSECISFSLVKRKPMNMPMWLAKIIANFGDLLGNKAPLNTNKLKKITSDLTFDDSKAREAFGWNPTPVLKGFKISVTK